MEGVWCLGIVHVVVLGQGESKTEILYERTRRGLRERSHENIAVHLGCAGVERLGAYTSRRRSIRILYPQPCVLGRPQG